VSYAVIWGPGVVFLATVLALLILPGFALIALTVVLIAAVAAIVALAAAIVATPYLLGRALVRRRRARSEAGQRDVPDRQPTPSQRPAEGPTGRMPPPGRVATGDSSTSP
jgi:membrane protein implicated in regulation of membrane protease activity